MMKKLHVSEGGKIYLKSTKLAKAECVQLQSTAEHWLDIPPDTRHAMYSISFL